MKLVIALCFTWCLLCINSCKKFDTAGEMIQSGIALTFDDCYVDNWYDYLPLLDSFGVKATFYISQYHRLSPAQKNKLAILRSKGHEIAFHTTNHPRMCQYLQAFGLNNLMQYEIYDDLTKMNQDGFYPKTFAYPYGEHNKILDDRLLKIFKSLRILNGTTDYTLSETATTSNSILYGLGMDKKSNTLKTIERTMESVSKNNTCLVLVGHRIEQPSSDLQVPYKRLKFILKRAKELNLRFYTVSEISN